jgi:ribA/ribD-fused uncharacterized protein
MIVNIKSGLPYDIYCGRANKTYGLAQSKWANPFVIGKDGTRDEVITKYRLWINCQPDLLECLWELKGKSLACWCDFPKENCHLSILHELANSKWIKNWFSNMLPFDKPMEYQGIEFRTVEHFYQAVKLPKDNLKGRAEIAAMGPHEAKKAIRDVNKYPWDENWNTEKSLKVMEYALRYKFQEGTSWHAKLILTEDWELVEWSNWGGKFWDRDIKTRVGENNLGKILMKIREESH